MMHLCKSAHGGVALWSLMEAVLVTNIALLGLFVSQTGWCEEGHVRQRSGQGARDKTPICIGTPQGEEK